MHIIIKVTPGEGKTLNATPVYVGYDNTKAQAAYEKAAKDTDGNERVNWYRKPAPYKSSRNRDPVTIEKPEPAEPAKEPESGKDEKQAGEESKKEPDKEPKKEPDGKEPDGKK